MDNEIRQTNYIVAVHDKLDRFAVENSIEEGELYVKQFPDRKAVIVSDTYRNDAMKKIGYKHVQSFRRGEFRLVDKKDNSDYDDVLNQVCKFINNGLLIIHDIMPGDSVFQCLFDVLKTNRAQDIIIHRNELALTQLEIEFVNSQVKQANQSVDSKKTHRPVRNVYFRIHALDEFKFNKEFLIGWMKEYGQELGFLLFLCQFILLKKANEYRKILEQECEKYGEKFENFIDPFYLRKESSNFVYLNLVTKDIVGADTDFLKECSNEIVSYFKENGE